MKQKNTRAKAQQLKFFTDVPRFFGGRLLHGKRRSQRPLAKKDALHLVFRSSWAKGATSFLKSYNKRPIEKILIATAAKYGVRIYRTGIASNHIHLVLRITNRRLYNTFIRVLTSKIASHVMQGKSFAKFKLQLLAHSAQGRERDKDNAFGIELQGNGQKFFQFRPFTRILNWGRDFKTCCEYVVQNTLEALGFVAYRPRKDRYGKWMRETFDSQGPDPDSAAAFA